MSSNRLRLVSILLLLLLLLVVWSPRPAPNETVAVTTPPPTPGELARIDADDEPGSLDQVTFPDAERSAVAPASAKRIDKTSKPAPAPRQVSVKLENVSTAQQEALARRLGFTVVDTIPSIGWVVIEPTDEAVSTDEFAAKLAAEPLVTVAEPTQLVFPASVPNDPDFSKQWGFQNTGQSGGVAGADSRAVQAWAASRGRDVVVAVSDTGVDLSHPDLAANAWVNPGEIAGNGIDDDGNGKIDDVHGWDFYNGNNTVFDANDGDQHGTHVAGTIAAATNNAIGGAGMSWDTKIMALKFLGPMGGSSANGAATIVYAVDNGADIINCSWGGTGYSQILADAVAYAAENDVLIVCAAGNSGVNTDATPFYPASLTTTNVVSVAALTRTDGLAGFSNYGATSVDLGAPGQHIYSTQPGLTSALFIDRSPYKIAYLAFPAESITSITARNQVVDRSVASLGTSLGDPILIVDDSWPSSAGEVVGSRLSKYQSALTAAGYTNVSVHSTESNGIPSAASMSGKTVVWFTGAATFSISNYSTKGTLTSAERTEIGNFLDGGGRMVMSSGELAFDMMWVGGSALTWYRNYFRANLATDDPWTTVLSGSSGGPLDGVSATIADPLRWTDGCDGVAPLDSYATTMANWFEYAQISGTSMAAPHVAGALALAVSRTPTATGTELKERLLDTAVPLASLAGKTASGGRLDAAALVGTVEAPAPLELTRVSVDTVEAQWVDPADSYLDRTRLLVRADTFPVAHDDSEATLVYEGADGAVANVGLADEGTYYFSAFSVTELGMVSEPATATVTIDALEPGQVWVPSGQGVDISMPCGSSYHFSEVTESGIMTCEHIEPRKGAPAGYRFLPGHYHNASTSAVFGGPVTVRHPYDPAALSGSAAQLAYFHDLGTGWEEITTSVDSEGHMITGVTHSFSDFGIAELEEPGDPVVASAELPLAALLAVWLVVAVVAVRYRRGAAS